ncbi:MAG: molybdopterin synthase catalytic subunit MoaE [Halothiobacillaceae bacterium]
MIQIQTQDFDVSQALAQLRAGNPHIGAVSCFVGTVRDINEGDEVRTLELEHYPVMTEKALRDIEERARARWSLENVLIIHRIGLLHPCDQIVLVAVASRHREESLQACAFIMDFLKTEAPFWKKEQTPGGERWVDARSSDDEARQRWLAHGPVPPGS